MHLKRRCGSAAKTKNSPVTNNSLDGKEQRVEEGDEGEENRITINLYIYIYIFNKAENCLVL